MNVLFLVVFIVCTALICVRDPSAFLPALLSGAERAVSLCITLAAVYARFWSYIHDIVRRPHGILVVLDDDERIPEIAQPFEGGEQSVVELLNQLLNVRGNLVEIVLFF